MDSELEPVNERIAANVRSLRLQRGRSLESLAGVCGVSRSALSLIERAESSPTAVVLDKIAAGLGVPLATLFAGALGGGAASPVARRADQAVWRDPSSGYRRRSVSPPGHTSGVEITEVTFPAHTRVAFDTVRGEQLIHQQLWVLEGAIEFSTAGETHRLSAGDCLASRLDQPTMFHNPTDRPARYALVIVSEPRGPR